MGIFDIFRRRAPLPAPNPLAVRSDDKQVTRDVEDAIWDIICTLPEVPCQLREPLYGACVQGVRAGRSLKLIADVFADSGILGMDRARAAGVAHFISNRTTCLMTKNRALALGLAQAKWLWSGAACFSHLAGMEVKAKGHREAGGKLYSIEKGMLIDGEYTWPGWAEGCNCVSNPIVPGFV